MKKLLSVFTLIAILITLVACSSTKDVSSIDFGKKYMLSEDQYYVFEEDQTGYCELYFKYESNMDSKYDFVLSGRVEFVWREASNGAIYLFRTETTYNEDHTEGKEVPLIDDPIYFSEEFFTYSRSDATGAKTINYIKEGSDLEKSIKD